MHIIVNSDVLYQTGPPVDRLPKHLEVLFREAAATGTVVVIPRTTLLEYEKRQADLVRDDVAQLTRAARLLRDHGVDIPDFEPERAVRSKSLVELITETGAHVQVEDPRIEDYRGAEERACKHLAPLQPNTKSDEMRDLVIWEIAVRIAARDGGAILFSRDGVHVKELGAEEAEAVNLHRLNSADAVLELLGRASPVAQDALALLTAVAPTLREAGLPLPAELSLQHVGKGAAFSTDAEGHLSGSFSFVMRVEDGVTAASASIIQKSKGVIGADLTDITHEGTTWGDGSLSLEIPGELPVVPTATPDAIADLRELIGQQGGRDEGAGEER